MSFFSRLQHLPSALVHRLHHAEAPKLHDNELQNWVQGQRSSGRSHAKDLALTVQHALDTDAEHLDLTGHRPDIMARLPLSVLARLRPSLDRLTLPRGCELGVIRHFLANLEIEELVAHDAAVDVGLRERELPGRLAVIRSNVSLLRPDDALSTGRVVDRREPLPASLAGVEASLPSRLAFSRAPALSSVGTVEQWKEAQQIAHRFKDQLARAVAETPKFLSGEAPKLRTLLEQLPVELMPARGREAARLAREWLREGDDPRLSQARIKQLQIAVDHAVTTFVVPEGRKLRMATGPELESLSAMRAFVSEGATSQERGRREADAARELEHRQLHHVGSVALFPPPLALRTGRPPSGVSASASDYDVPPTRAALHAPDLPARREVPVPVGDREASVVYDTPPSRRGDPAYDVPRRHDAGGDYEVPAPISTGSPARPPAGKDRVIMRNPSVDPKADRPMARLSVRDLALADQEVRMFSAWSRTQPRGFGEHMNVSPLQLRALTRATSQASEGALPDPLVRAQILACKRLLDRIDQAVSGYPLSRTAVILLEQGMRGLQTLEADERPPQTPPRRSIRGA